MWTDHSINFAKERRAMENAPTGPSTVAPMGKKKVKRESFMGEICPCCHRTFKIQKDYNDFRLICPYCGKRVESTRILKQKLETL